MQPRFCYNKRAQETLAAFVNGGRFPHALLLEGPEGSGRRTFAREIAAALFCRGEHKPCGSCSQCRKVLERNHPDVEYYGGDGSRRSFHIDTMRSNVSYKAVENKEVDMGLITNPHFFKKVQTVPLFEEKLVLVCSKDTAYEDGILPSRLKSEDEIYIPWSDSFIMWHDYWFGNNSEVKVSLDNMALLRQLLDLEKTWAIMPATIGKKLSQEGECRIVALENGPEYRTCYAIMGDRRNAAPLVMDFLQELLDTVKGIPEIRVLTEYIRQAP